MCVFRLNSESLRSHLIFLSSAAAYMPLPMIIPIWRLILKVSLSVSLWLISINCNRNTPNTVIECSLRKQQSNMFARVRECLCGGISLAYVCIDRSKNCSILNILCSTASAWCNNTAIQNKIILLPFQTEPRTIAYKFIHSEQKTRHTNPSTAAIFIPYECIEHSNLCDMFF